jgi:hypothetical protein
MTLFTSHAPSDLTCSFSHLFERTSRALSISSDHGGAHSQIDHAMVRVKAETPPGRGRHAIAIQHA